VDAEGPIEEKGIRADIVRDINCQKQADQKNNGGDDHSWYLVAAIGSTVTMRTRSGAIWRVARVFEGGLDLDENVAHALDQFPARDGKFQSGQALGDDLPLFRVLFVEPGVREQGLLKLFRLVLPLHFERQLHSTEYFAFSKRR
jgi:hypothetical protein